MRIFEQAMLCDEVTGASIAERRFEDGTVEWWASVAVNIFNGQATQTIPVPFKIEAANRVEAFEQVEAQATAFLPVAKAQVSDMIEKQRRAQASQLVLANALPPAPKVQ